MHKIALNNQYAILCAYENAPAMNGRGFNFLDCRALWARNDVARFSKRELAHVLEN